MPALESAYTVTDENQRKSAGVLAKASSSIDGTAAGPVAW
jgi:hypothetical protein